MCQVNKIFRVAADVIMDGAHFPRGRKGIICTAVGDTAPLSDTIFAASKGSLGDVRFVYQYVIKCH